jgi:hypothetical protein
MLPFMPGAKPTTEVGILPNAAISAAPSTAALDQAMIRWMGAPRYRALLQILDDTADQHRAMRRRKRRTVTRRPLDQLHETAALCRRVAHIKRKESIRCAMRKKR